jgi:hypothetical protein
MTKYNIVRRNRKKQNIFAILTCLFMLFSLSQAQAGYIFGGIDPADFSIFNNPTKWEPNFNTSRVGGFPSIGGATWSIMAAGLTEDSALVDSFNHIGLTQDITVLGLSLSSFESMVDSMLNLWGDASGFSNLGQVADSGSSVAGQNATGDIRISAWDIANPSTLAHAFQPGTEEIFGFVGSIGGDLHFDTGYTFVDDANANSSTFDIYTIALHELGHTLGLSHSNVQGSVMEAIYAGSRRSLSEDDIAGITSIYGPAPLAVNVPEPSTLFIFLLGLLGLKRRHAHDFSKKYKH